MEALQVLKFALKKERLNFTSHLHLPEEPLAAYDAESSKSLTEVLRMKPEALKAFLDTLDD